MKLSKKWKVISSILIGSILSVLIIGCSSLSKNTDVSAFARELQKDIGYDTKYIEDRNVIRVSDYISKETIVEAVSEDEVYAQWTGMGEELLSLYNTVEEFGKSKNIKNIEYEIVVIDKESSKTDKEVPLLIIDKTGITFDMVKEIKNK